MVKKNTRKLKSKNLVLNEKEQGEFEIFKNGNIFKSFSSSKNFIFYRCSICRRGGIKYCQKNKIYFKHSSHEKHCLLMNCKNKILKGIEDEQIKFSQNNIACHISEDKLDFEFWDKEIFTTSKTSKYFYENNYYKEGSQKLSKLKYIDWTNNTTKNIHSMRSLNSENNFKVKNKSKLKEK
jgi:hypothetical protein